MPGRAKGQCPHCKGEQIVHGRLLPQAGISGGIVFRPRKRKWWSFILPDAKVSGTGYACIECGLLWTNIGAGRLKMLMRREE